MKSKNVLLAIALALTMTMVPFALAENGPRSDDLLIRIYLNPDAENFALEAGTVDINDWPLTKFWVDEWTDNPDIQMLGFSEIGQMEIDINSQRWPTGVTEPRTWDPATETYKHYYGTSEWDDEARDFRKAISLALNKDYIVTNILMGMGIKMDVAMPGALSGVVPWDELIAQGLIYAYDPDLAVSVLDAAGFTQGATTNPYYDSGETWSAEYLRTDPRYGGDLQALEFYVRVDDPNRRAAGEFLRDTLRIMGIQVNDHIVERTVCYDQVMVLYDFHLYTGGWSLTADLDWLYWLYSSEMYWGGTATSYYGGVGWSLNYGGFAFPEFDSEAGTILTATAADQVSEAVKKGIIAMQKGIAYAPMWSSAGVKAHRTYDITGTEEWRGVVNYKGLGIDNSYTFLNMYNPLDPTIDYSFKSNLESIHVICAEWLWDWNVIGLIYDAALELNPYTLAAGDEYPFLAESWSTGADAGGDYVLYAMRSDAEWHDGNAFEPWDYAFSVLFTRDCGDGVAWVYTNVMDVDYIEVKTLPAYAVAHPDIHVNPALGDQDVKIYFTYPSFWLLHWASISAINPHVWLAANAEFGWNFGSVVGGTLGTVPINWDPIGGSGPNAKGVREYHPWDENVYNVGAGLVDLAEDGAGPWIYENYAPTPGTIETATAIYLTANKGATYYKTQAEISEYLIRAFSDTGNVNNPLAYYKNHLPDPTAPPPDYYYEYTDEDNNGIVDWPIDMLISGLDVDWTKHMQGAADTYPPEACGVDWWQWNQDPDFDHDGYGTFIDLIIVSVNYDTQTGPP